MLYEIVNPSDRYTIECEDLQIATVACCLLGGGQYAFRPLEAGGEEVPMFLFGGVEPFCRQHFKNDFADVLASVKASRREALAAALDSVVVSDRGEYLAVRDALPEGERQAFRARWHDERRSSMNDIGGRAYAMARQLRDGAEPVARPPRQVFGG